MEFRRINATNCDAYAPAMDLYRMSFPYHEQRETASQATIMGHPAYHFNCIEDAGKWVGILLCWETETFIYVEHFCIFPKLRNQQYGKKALEHLHTLGKTVILEIDPPTDEIAVHRKSFYERVGYQANPFLHVHPPYHKDCQGHALVVMSYPNRLSEQEYARFDQYLKSVVMH